VALEKVCILGLGYIGLPTGALLANRGYEVFGVDVIQEVVDTINSGKVHIIEPELDTFVQSAVRSGKLKANTVPEAADIFIIAVPTPFKEGNKPDLSYVEAAAQSIAPFVKPGNLVILESTSPIGTTEKVEAILREFSVETEKIFIAYCPERVLPGQVMKELIENDRIVGGLNQASTDKVAAFYSRFVSGEVIRTNAKTAELCKLSENSYRDTNIAFANELSLVCDQAGINVWELINLANKHPRVNILQPGTGVGGHCIAVDPWFIISEFPNQSKLIRAAREVNNYKTEWVIEKIQNAALEFEIKNHRKPILALLGLSFKPNIDDLRESPAVKVARSIHKLHNTLVVEPHIHHHSEFKLVSLDEGLEQADILVYLVGHKLFKSPAKSEKIVLDFCNISS
jgi:UDP-N-acetyl-D-mannosaminuronic acid dehydrogenase